ncbi:MAG: hypothetical protein KBT34_12830 [Prevotella sp.]|nr:hypothetical protein [Candidatus Prevotella equi]
MQTVNISVNVPTQPHFNVDKFRHRMQDFASTLVMLMSRELIEQKTDETTADQDYALSFIKSLAVEGGKDIPANVNPIECLVDTKYEE